MNMKNGFTLIELSIVLVVIGLLTGGILVGQSLIESVKTSRFASDLSQYSIATLTFKQKFKQFPGDSTYFTPPGNGDGIAGQVNDIYETYEPALAWSQLSQAQMLKKQFDYDPAKIFNSRDIGEPSNIVYKEAAPMAKTQESESPIYLEFDKNSAAFASKQYFNAFNFQAKSTLLWGLENKFDDGVPSLDSGTIWAGKTGRGAPQPCTALSMDALPENLRNCSIRIYFSPTSAPELPLTTN